MQSYQISQMLQNSRRTIIHQLLQVGYKRQPSHEGLTPEHSTKIPFNLHGVVLTHEIFLTTQMLLSLIPKVPDHRDPDADAGGPLSVFGFIPRRDSPTNKELYPISKTSQELSLELHSRL